MKDEDFTDRNKTDRLIDLVDELGLSAPEPRPKRFPIRSEDVHLIAWMALIPSKEQTVTWAGEFIAPPDTLPL